MQNTRRPSAGTRSRPGDPLPAPPAILVLAATLVLTPTALPAQGSEMPSLTFDAYGTLGLVYSTEDRADFIANPLQPNGPGRTEELTHDLDSRIGGQATFRLTPELRVVAQTVVERNHEDEYRPRLEWAYVQYDIAPGFTLRAGRTPNPAFLTSEYRKVSYAYPYVRPPVELYSSSPVTSGEGLDLSYRVHTGDWTNTVQISFGSAEGDFQGGSAEADNTWNLSYTLERQTFTGRAALATGLLDVDAFDPFFDAFRSFGPEGTAIAERFEVDDTPFEFATLGAQYTPGNWLGMTEIGYADFNSVFGEKIAGYVTGGYRLGPVMPYATYSRVDALSDTSHPGVPLQGLSQERMQTAQQLNAGLNMFLRGTAIQQNMALGARWDAFEGVAFKLQVDFIDVAENSAGTFINRTENFEHGGSVEIVSLATSFVL